MSVVREYDLVGNQRRAVREHTDALRWVALGCLFVVTATYLHILFWITGIVGGTGRLLAVTLLAGAAGVVAAHTVAPRGAAVIAGVGLLVGTMWYVQSVPEGIDLLLGIGSIILDWLALLSGFTVLGIVAADVWAATFAPVPVFLSWYFGIRGEYARAGAIGGAAAAFFMMTGDLGAGVALLAVIAVAGVVGFGEMAQRQARLVQAELVVLLLAAMLLASFMVPIIPAHGGKPITPGSSVGGGSDSLENSLLGGGEELRVAGQPSLDPTVRYTVTSPVPGRWRVDAYDRYTGEGWVQTSPGQAVDDPGPETENVQRIQMTVRAELDGLRSMPTMWEPVAVDSEWAVSRSPEGGLLPEDPLSAGDRYFVTVEQVDTLITGAPDVGEEYPAAIRERYTQLPDSTPERVAERTTEVISDPSDPYQAAIEVETYLLRNYNYSLDVPPPNGDMADTMLFERQAGYCTWFATTMITMLRTQDIPARLATGYSSGEPQAGEDWVVRGMNAHAWVEVYLPEVGWVAFDPTPSEPYNNVRRSVLDEAREEGTGQIEADPVEDLGDWEPSLEMPERGTEEQLTQLQRILRREDELQQACGDPAALEQDEITREEALIVCDPVSLEAMGLIDEPGDLENITLPSDNVTLADPANRSQTALTRDDPLNETGSGANDADGSAGPLGTGPVPPLEDLGVILALGLIAGIGARRAGVFRRARYEMAIRWPGAGRDPSSTIERAWGRFERHCAETGLERETGESARAFVTRVSGPEGPDERLVRLLSTYERSRFGDEPISRADAREIAKLVTGLINDERPH